LQVFKQSAYFKCLIFGNNLVAFFVPSLRHLYPTFYMATIHCYSNPTTLSTGPRHTDSLTVVILSSVCVIGHTEESLQMSICQCRQTDIWTA